MSDVAVVEKLNVAHAGRPPPPPCAQDSRTSKVDRLCDVLKRASKPLALYELAGSLGNTGEQTRSLLEWLLRQGRVRRGKPIESPHALGRRQLITYELVPHFREPEPPPAVPCPADEVDESSVHGGIVAQALSRRVDLELAWQGLRRNAAHGGRHAR